MALPNPPALTQTGPVYVGFATKQYVVVPTISNQAAPTLAEVNAGKNVSFQTASVTGFDTSVASLDVPRLGTNFTSNMPGRETANASSMTFYLSQTGPSDDVRSVAQLLQNATGYLLIFNEGIVTGGMMDVWPYRVGAVSISQDPEVVAVATVDFNIWKPPTKYVTVPTA